MVREQDDWLKDREISADKILVARQCRMCGGTPQALPEKMCYPCKNTGREVFYLSECWWIDTTTAAPHEIAAFKAQHAFEESEGGPRVQSRTLRQS